MINLAVLGLILDIVGVLILTLITMINPRHTKKDNIPFWLKRYTWYEWRPFYRHSETKKLIWDWKYKKYIKGWIPPKHQFEIIGFLFVFDGFLFQLLFYLS